MKSGRIAVLACLLVGLLLVRYVVLTRFPSSAQSTHTQTPAPAFTTPVVKQAAAKATSDHKFLVIDAMAQWCGPCKAMEHNSWSSPDVQSWMNDNAVFTQVDVDADEDTSRQLGIEAMPTIILIKDGTELKRSEGYMDAGDLLDWLKSG
jgi:thioredoxin 1